MTGPDVRLGKKLGKVEDRRTFQFKDFVPRKATAAPPKRSQVGRGTEYRMFANDRHGCCTMAALGGHRVQAQEKASRQIEDQLTDDDILVAYDAISPFDRHTGRNDNGAYMLDALNYARTVGIGRERDGTPHTIGAFVEVNVSRQADLERAAWMLGGLYLGIWLPLTAYDQMRAGKKWTPAKGPDSKPGSWGGHAVYADARTESSITCATWGKRQAMSWDFLSEYCDEAYAVVSEDFLKKSGKTPQGFDVEALNEALNQMRK